MNIKSFRVLRTELKLIGWGALLNGFWEFAQSPLYTDHRLGAGHVLWTRLHCTGGDLLILLGAFWITAILFHGRDWWRRKSILPAIAIFTSLGFGYTAFSEWLNTEVVGAWAYAPAMPRLGVWGVSPLLQWLLLPPLIIYLGRRSRVRSDLFVASAKK